MKVPFPTPSEIRAPRGGDTLTIVWESGETSVYSHRILRGFCPCATCQGHQGPVEFREGGNLELSDIQEVGNYAVRLIWADDHSTGIYSFAYLKRLAGASEKEQIPR